MKLFKKLIRNSAYIEELEAQVKHLREGLSHIALAPQVLRPKNPFKKDIQGVSKGLMACAIVAKKYLNGGKNDGNTNGIKDGIKSSEISGEEGKETNPDL